MVDIQEVERIQFKMQRIRRHMDEDVDRLQADAAQLMDWKYYLQRYPIVSVAAISAAGFLVVPRSRPAPVNRVYLDPETSREIAEATETLHVENDQSMNTQGAEKGIIMTLGALAANTLVKAGMAYITQQLRQTWLSDFKPAAQTRSGSPS